MWHLGVRPRVYTNHEAALKHGCAVIKQHKFIGRQHENHERVFDLIESGELQEAIELWNEIQESLAAEGHGGYTGDSSEPEYIEIEEYEVLSKAEEE
jgi:hypothetical protein